MAEWKTATWGETDSGVATYSGADADISVEAHRGVETHSRPADVDR